MSHLDIQLPSATLMNVLDATAKTLSHAELTTHLIYQIEVLNSFGTLNDNATPITLDNYKVLLGLSCFLARMMNSYINNAANFRTALRVIDNQLNDYIEKCRFDFKFQKCLSDYKSASQKYL
ncbi:hypothetical protein HB371_18895 [Acinetobacter baumannii]|uniref:hypothetical protein n=1 Tax=Acinetobacter baumannii TaxID=470 RepID=UPI0014592EB4|nr:hypothetical protein [Acinetobacter baumannii]NLZ24034.1 hypothetical protein [Acinetobacter baumannii]